MKHPDLDNARRAREAASIDLITVVKRLFPVGAQFDVWLGRAVVRLEVLGHSDAWTQDPELIFGRNVITGKRRKFRPGSVLGGRIK